MIFTFASKFYLLILNNRNIENNKGIGTGVPVVLVSLC